MQAIRRFAGVLVDGIPRPGIVSVVSLRHDVGMCPAGIEMADELLGRGPVDEEAPSARRSNDQLAPGLGIVEEDPLVERPLDQRLQERLDPPAAEEQIVPRSHLPCGSGPRLRRRNASSSPRFSRADAARTARNFRQMPATCSGRSRSKTSTLSPKRFSNSGRPSPPLDAGRVKCDAHRRQVMRRGPPRTRATRPSSPPAKFERVRADVAREDDHRLREVGRLALAVGQPAVVEDLEELVHHPAVGLLDLVEQQQAERPLADPVGEVAPFLVADVAWGRARQLLGGVLPRRTRSCRTGRRRCRRRRSAR